jgi:hypothetical protein
MLRLGARILRTVDKRLLWKFVWNFVKGMLSVERFKRRLKRGEYFRRFSISPSSTVATCAARAAGSMSSRPAR